MAQEHIVKIISVTPVTHNVKQFRIEKPEGYKYIPGQATEISINKEGWQAKKNPFTFTSLNSWPHLEFTIKAYPDRGGVTNELHKLQAGDELILRDPWGTIAYEGQGYFIAGGAGITPFISILRQLQADGEVEGNVLYFSNKTAADIILREELTEMLGLDAHFIITQEPGSPYINGKLDKEFIEKHITDLSKPVYVCGTDDMVDSMITILENMGIPPEKIVFER